tara:strand:- start:260 stop:1402 length:1143 start_codon:yes stop_codon:yes gene_type:complete
MSQVDYTIDLPPVPSPRVSPELGVMDIPSASMPQSGAFGESSFDIPELLPIQQGQNGFIFGQISKVITISNPANGATTVEYQTALASIYAVRKPKYGDIVTFITTESAFDSRFIVFPEGDGAPSNSTIAFTSSSGTWYAYNFSATSLSSITDAIDQALGQFDQSGTVARDDDIDEEVAGGTDAEFQISISNLYSVDPSTNALEIGGNPNVVVDAGTVEPMQGLTFPVPQKSNNTLTVPLDGSVRFLHIYVQYEINFTGSQGSRVANTVTDGEILFYEAKNSEFLEGGFFGASQTVYTHRTYIGNVQVVRRGSRRFAKIVQFRSGKVNGIQNFNTKQSGTTTDSGGADVAAETKSGLREVTLCLNGKPYSTFIITSALFEI